MARRNYDKTELPGFDGGIDLDSSPFTVPPNCLIGCLNVLPSLNTGGISLINGYTLQNTNSQITKTGAGVPVNGLFSFYDQNGNTEYFIAQGGTDLWNNSPEGTFTTITGTLTITNTQNNLASFAVLNNILYGVNRSGDQMWQWTLSGNATAVPSGALYTVAINAGGTGYVVGDILNVTGGSGSGGKVNVTGVSGGIITAITINALGSAYVVTTSAATTGGTGSGATIAIQTISSPPGGTFLVNFNNTIFGNYGSTNPNLVGYSDLNIGYQFNPVNFLIFNTGQGNTVTGAANGLFGNLIVFKTKSIHVVQPTGSVPSYSNYLFVDGIGCVSHQSIVTLPGGQIMWWDTDDIYTLVGNQVLSATNHPQTGNSRLRNFFRNSINNGRLPYVCGVYYKDLDVVEWKYSSPSSNSNDMTLYYHVKTKSFWISSQRGTSIAIRTIQSHDQVHIGDTDGFIYREDNGGTFNGSAIIWNAQIPWQALGDLLARKKGDLAYVVLQQPTTFNILCDVYINQNTTAYISSGVLQTIGVSGAAQAVFDTAVFDTSTFAQANTQLMEASMLINTLFKTISLNFHGSNTNQPLSIYKVAITSRMLDLSRLTD